MERAQLDDAWFPVSPKPTHPLTPVCVTILN